MPALKLKKHACHVRDDSHAAFAGVEIIRTKHLTRTEHGHEEDDGLANSKRPSEVKYACSHSAFFALFLPPR